VCKVSSASRATGLHGRSSECQLLDRLLAAGQAGQSQVLVLRGEAGIGKSALLDYLGQRATGWRVLRAAGAESEMELAFAGLHQLCAPMLDRLDRLSAPQHDALATAFGLSPGSPPDRFLVGLATLGVLSDAAADQPLLCLIDDAQWLDRVSAQTLAFVARRLLVERIALVFASRDAAESHELAGLPDVQLDGLRDRDARALLDTAVTGRLDERVRDRIVAETRGNPLALLELPRGFTAAELAGGFGLLSADALPGWIEESYRRQLTPLGEQTRQLLLLAAAEPVGDPVLVWQAAKQLGIDGSVGDATSTGLIEFGARVRFRHPLARSAIYRAASPTQRWRTHHALAQVTDPDADPDRHAWHAAQAASEPDEVVAGMLEHSATRAQARGGLAAAAAFLSLATELTPDAARRASRALSAARVQYQAGLAEAALTQLSLAASGPLEVLQQAQADLLRAEISFALDGSGDAAPLLLDAARQMESLDVRTARDTYLEAFAAAQFAGRLAGKGGVRNVAVASRAAPAGQSPPNAADLLLDGLALRFTDGYTAGAPVLKRALNAFCEHDAGADDGLRWIWLPCLSAVDLWDDEAGSLLAARNVQLAREAGALAVLPLALTSRIAFHIFSAELNDAAALLEEFNVVTEATGNRVTSYGALLLAAWQGDEARAVTLIDDTVNESSRRGEGMALTVGEWAKALLFNGLCRYEKAMEAAEAAADRPEDLCFSNWSLGELVEAAVRSGQPERAKNAMNRLTELTTASGTDWALGTQAAARALLCAGAECEAAYQEAIERLGRTRIRGALARAHLTYGEWLRRENRRVDARQHLRTAHDILSRIGAGAFAERARRELEATGETARKREPQKQIDLTIQESQIARLARDGLTNPEIGAMLFLSTHTVEWHLRKVFAKLAISSRKQLRDVLVDPVATA
jgi:DNA-binding CsgD family transcriptional regulator